MVVPRRGPWYKDLLRMSAVASSAKRLENRAEGLPGIIEDRNLDAQRFRSVIGLHCSKLLNCAAQ